MGRRFSSLILMSVLVAALTPAQYARYGLLTSAFVLLVPLLSLNLQGAPSRLAFDSSLADRRATLYRTSLAGALTLATGGYLLILLALRLGAGTDPVSEGSLSLQAVIGLAVLSQVALQLFISILRITGDAAAFAVTSLLEGFGIVGGFVLFSLWIDDAFLALAWAFAVSMALAAAIGFARTRRLLAGSRLDVGLFREALAYSWPTVVHLAALWGVSSSGRWIGANYLPLGSLAPYTLVTQMVAVVGMFGRALFDARVPEIGTAFGEGRLQDARKLVRDTALQAAAIVLLVYAGVFVLLYGLKVQLPRGYHPEPFLLAVGALASLADAFYLNGIQQLQGVKRTGHQATASLVSGSLSVGISFWLVQRHGIEGLVVGLAAGMMLQALLSNGMAAAVLRVMTSNAPQAQEAHK